MGKKKIPHLLIVVEGYTEQSYFTEIRDEIRSRKIVIRSFNVEGEQKPERLIELAWNYYREDTKDIRPKSVFREGEVYEDDEVWCVVDRDNKSVKDMSDLEKLAADKRIRLIYSIPSIELWFYLHFVSDIKTVADRLCNSDGSSVSQNDMNILLKSVWSNYHKSHKDMHMHYLRTISGREGNAVANAIGLRQYNEAQCYQEFTKPFTNVDLLVKRMRQI